MPGLIYHTSIHRQGISFNILFYAVGRWVQLKWRMVSGFHGGDYEEYDILDYKFM
jgi:hypothetical protein